MNEFGDKKHCCCFTGHRPEKLHLPEPETKRLLKKAIMQAVMDGYTVFLSGMARGIDIWAAETVLELKKENDKLKAEIDDLRKKLIEMGDYKEEVDEKAQKSIDKLKEEIVSLKSELKIKQSNYDKLSNESQKSITDLRNQIDKLKKDAENQSSKGGFLNRFK